MAYQARVLVIASQTASSPELVAALKERQDRGPMVPTLLMPANGIGFAGKEECRPRLDAALAQWREAGVAGQGIVGDPDPAVAVQETWDPRSYDEVIVSTLPGRTSKWLQADLPHRVQQITGCDVVHIEAGAKRNPNYGPVPDKPEKDDLGLFRLHAQKNR
jgi:hypothetical protein